MLPPTRTSQLHRLFFALVVLTLLLLLWTPTLLTSNSEPSPNDATSTPDLVFKLHEGAQTGIDRVKDGLRVLWKTATSDATGLEEHVNERWRNASILDATEGVALDEELSKSLNQVLLPLCNRSLLIRASGSRGFASEFNRILRLAAIGEHFGYEVFVESRMWVYGTFDEYFEPRANRTCTIATLPPWIQRQEIIPHGDILKEVTSPSWTRRDHIVDPSSGSMDYLDELFLSISSDHEALARLHLLELASFPPSVPLSGRGTVPAELENGLSLLERQARLHWVLRPDIQAMVDALRSALSWATEKPSDLIIGLHVRLGDKCGEAGRPSHSTLRFATPEQLESHRQAYPLKKCTITELDSTLSNTYLSAVDDLAATLRATQSSTTQAGGRVRVLVMSDEEAAVEKLSVVGGGFTGEGVEMISLARLATATPEAQGAGAEVDDAFAGGFKSKVFSQLPLEVRIASTKHFLRDLTILASLSDGLVFTGSSNVGRLLAVLGGLEMAKEGVLRSCDTRFFGTAHFN